MVGTFSYYSNGLKGGTSMELGVAIVWLLIGILIGLSIALWINLVWIFPAVYNFVKQNNG